MGSYFYLVANSRVFAGQRRSERIKRKHKFSASRGALVLGRKALAISLLAMIALMCVAYLVLINIRMTKGFEIKELEQRLSEAEKTQKQLEARVADLQSIQSIEDKLDISGFVPTTNVSYLKAGDYALVSVPDATP